MNIVNFAKLSKEAFAQLKNELVEHKTLGSVLTWASARPKSEVLPHIVAETITQDEYTHDIIIPFRELFLVFDTT